MSEDRPRYAATKTPPDPLPTNAEIAERLRRLTDDMHAIGVDMKRLDVPAYRVLGIVMIDRAGTFRTWAQRIEGAQG